MNFSPDLILYTCIVWLVVLVLFFGLLARAERTRRDRQDRTSPRHLPVPNYDIDSPSARIAEHSGRVEWLDDHRTAS